MLIAHKTVDFAAITQWISLNYKDAVCYVNGTVHGLGRRWTFVGFVNNL